MGRGKIEMVSLPLYLLFFFLLGRIKTLEKKGEMCEEYGTATAKLPHRFVIADWNISK